MRVFKLHQKMHITKQHTTEYTFRDAFILKNCSTGQNQNQSYVHDTVSGVLVLLLAPKSKDICAQIQVQNCFMTESACNDRAD